MMTQKDKYEEYEFIIVSLIRVLAMSDLSMDDMASLYNTSLKVKQIEADGGVISNERIHELYNKEVSR